MRSGRTATNISVSHSVASFTRASRGHRPRAQARARIAGNIARMKSDPLRIAIVGDLNPDYAPHAATELALKHAAERLGLTLAIEWLPTERLSDRGRAYFAGFAGFWIAPGSPYKDLLGALAAIRFCRESAVPLLGTCGGFQHVVIEYARNRMGVADAAHAEYDANASRLFIAQLSCSVAGKTLPVQLRAGSRARSWYGSPEAVESYYCNFGLNPAFQNALDAAGLRVTGIDDTGECRVLELPDHPFFLATLFLPQLNSRPEQPHPLVVAYLDACRHAASR